MLECDGISLGFFNASMTVYSGSVVDLLCHIFVGIPKPSDWAECAMVGTRAFL